MTSLQKLSMKLSQHRTTTDDTGNITAGTTTGNQITASNTSELELWATRIRSEGNRPADWLEYIKHMHCVADCMTDKERRYNYLSGLYNKALESIPQEFVKEEPYAKILVRFAKLLSLYDTSSAEMLFKKATTDCRHFSFVHIAAAEFFSSQGDKHKAKRVLEKAKIVYHSKPVEDIQKAFGELVGSNAKIGSRREQLDSTSGHTGNTSQMFKEDLGSSSTFSDTFTQGAERAGKENQPPQKREFRNSSSDEADTLPILRSIDLSKPDDRPPRTLRSYHSTPDCKSAGALSVEKKEPSLSTRKRVICMGRAMRIKANQLPRVTEKDDDSSDEDNIRGIKPLPIDSPPATADANTADTGYLSSAPEFVKKGVLSDFKQPINVKKDMKKSSMYFSERKHSVMDVDEDDRPVAGAGESFTNPIRKLSLADVEMKPELMASATRHRWHSNPEQEKENYAHPGYMKDLDRKFSLMDVDSDFAPVAGLPQPEPMMPAAQMRADHMVPPPGHPSMHHGSYGATPGGAPYQLSTPVHHPGLMPHQGNYMMQTPVGNVAPVCTPIMQNQNDVVIVKGKTYTVLKVIGRGGSSKVYEVYENSKRLCAAIKRVELNDADEFTVQSYKNEINLLKRLQYSDKVVKMYDYEYIEESNVLYVVMERGDTDLANFFKNKSKHGGISQTMIKFYWAEMLKAVQVLHKEGIVHSDLKPANFLLVAGNVKLIDFGIANAIQQDKTSVTRESQIGTLNYMSPEAISQADCAQVFDSEGCLKPKFKLGVKSDVWSLGCILYYMVYQKAPFHHIGHNLAKLQAIVNPNVPIPFPKIKDKNLMHVLQNCLKRNPKERLGIDELLIHPYLEQDVKSPPDPSVKSPQDGGAMYRFANQLITQLGIDSPNSAQNLSKSLIQQFKTGQSLDLGSLVQQKQDGQSYPS